MNNRAPYFLQKEDPSRGMLMAQLLDPQMRAAPDVFRQTWDTSDVPRSQRYSYFREGVCQAFLSFTPEELPDRQIQARISTARLDGGIISKIAVTPHRVFRTRMDVAKIDGDYMSLGLQSSGGLSGDLHGKPFVQKAGSISLINATRIRSFEIDPSERYTATALLFEKSRLGGFPNLDDFYIVGTTYMLPIKMCLFLINERYETASKSYLTHLFEATLALLKAALRQDGDVLQDHCVSNPAIRNGVVLAIQAFIGKTIADPALSTISVARQFGISARYVQKLCADEGLSLKSYITATRLDKVQMDLFDPSIAHVAVSDIAFRWGFRDMTTFHRNFKIRFGDTPNQTRARRQKARVAHLADIAGRLT